MAPDPHCIVASVVHAKAIHVTNPAECSRCYGLNAKKKLAKGVVVQVHTPSG